MFYTFGWMCWAHGSPHSPVPGPGPFWVPGEAPLGPRCREMAAAAPRWGGAASGFRGGAGKMAATKRVLYVGAWGWGGACAGLFGAAGVLWGHWGRLGSNAVPAAGGLAEEVDEKVLHAAFIPFGDITDIQIPLDYETGACRGSGGGRPAGWAAAP